MLDFEYQKNAKGRVKFNKFGFKKKWKETVKIQKRRTWVAVTEGTQKDELNSESHIWLDTSIIQILLDGKWHWFYFFHFFVNNVF